MARRMNIPKAKQIQGCRKALANPRTPKQFIPGLKKRLKKLLGVVILAAIAPALAHAQFVGYTAPQTVTQILTTGGGAGQSCNPSFSVIVNNLGQTVHQITYATAGLSAVTVQVQGTADGVVFTTLGQSTGGAGTITAQGYYVQVKVNFSCPAGGKVTANYSGTPVSPTYLAADTDSNNYVQLIGIDAAANTNKTFQLIVPYGSTYGIIFFQYNLAGPAGSTLQVSQQGSAVDAGFGPFAGNITPTLALGTGSGVQAFLIPAVPGENINVVYTSGGASGSLYNIEYLFFKPGTGLIPGAQPPTPLNSESTSAANTAVSKTITGLASVRAHLFSVSARCSAGTGQLTVADGATQIWSTAATEVSTTTFRFQWNPGLSASPGNNLVVTLGTCGAANTGTLDVQASQF